MGGVAGLASRSAATDRGKGRGRIILAARASHPPEQARIIRHDPVGIELMHYIGADNVMWSIDYPHPESCYGYTDQVAKGVYDRLGHEDAKKILGQNAIDLYGFKPPADWNTRKR